MERLYSVFTNKLSALLLAFLLISTAAFATPFRFTGAGIAAMTHAPGAQFAT